jgi:dihydrodipicolinate synthase/N-acetylneuraminate lyase
MVTAKDVQGVMAMMPSFSTEDAGDLSSKNTVDVDNLKIGVDRMINDGIDVITTTGSFGECYNLDWDEYKTLAVAAVDAVKARASFHWRNQSECARGCRPAEVCPRHRRRWNASWCAVL